MFVKFILHLLLLCVLTQSHKEDILISGPGLKPEEIIMPARYFFINFTYVNAQSYTSELNQNLVIDINGRTSTSKHCRVWVNKLDRKDGTFIVRYKVYETCLDLSIHVHYKKRDVAKSPYSFKGPIYPDQCNCPENDFETWFKDYGCSNSYEQITRDLKPFRNLYMKEEVQKVIQKYHQPDSISFCHYTVKQNEIYRNCYGKHIGFNMFSDNILLSLTRKVNLPDMELIINLGDWPLVHKGDKPLPVFSWCGSDETLDIVMPTYDLTESTLENMGRVTLDTLSVQSGAELAWQERDPRAIWRGRDSRSERLKLIDIARANPHLFNASLTNFFFFRNKEAQYGPKQPHISFFKFFDYKYQINIDGTVAAYRMPYLLAGGGMVLKQDSPYYEHFYGQLEAWEHFVPVNRDLSNLVDRVKWAQKNDKKAQQIAINARNFANEHLLPHHVICYHAALFWMVNKYKRKTSNASWDEDVMKLAMEEASKTSVHGAAKINYGINLSTLQRHLKKGCPKMKLGRFQTVFTAAQETELLEYLFYMENLFFGLTKSDFLKLVYQYAERNKLTHPFKNGAAGEDWYAGFKTRYHEVSLRRPEPTSIVRARAFNRPQVERFFDLLEAEIDKHKIDATRIYNVDETGIQSTNNKPPRVLCRSGKKHVGIIPSVERGKLTTVVCCCNAAGSFVPPFLIFRRKRMVDRLLDGAPPGSAAICSDNGWINGPVFLEWLRHFVDTVRPTKEKKVILVMDNHESHKYLGALEFASKSNIIFVSLPPHTTHRMQPLDTCVYGPLKIYFEQSVSVFQRTHVGRIISQYVMARLFGEAYLKAASAQNAVKGFSSTGIWPTNRNIFDDSDYMPSNMTERPNPVCTQNEADLISHESQRPVDKESGLRSDVCDSDRTVSPSVLEQLDFCCTCTTPTPTAVDEIITEYPVEFLTPAKNNDNEDTVTTHMTPMDIRPIPEMKYNQTTHRRKTQRSEILTSTPIKEQQREKEAKKKDLKKKSATLKTNLNNQKPSTSGKRAKRGPQKSKKTEYRCLVCSEVYTGPPVEDWIRCDDCELWSNEACTSYSGTGSYYCDMCHE